MNGQEGDAAPAYLVHMPAAEARHLAGAAPTWPPVPQPEPRRPVRGPFGPRYPGRRLPGQVDYLGKGTVRLDGTAVRSLAALAEGEDFRVTWTGAGPVLAVGPDAYLAQPEEPGAQPEPAG